MSFINFKKISSFVLVSGLCVVLVSTFTNAFDASRLKKKKTETVVSEKTDNADDAKKVVATGADKSAMDKQIQSGKELYGNTCLFCHGAKGKGARAPSLIAGHWAPGGANDDKYMMSVIKDGRENTIMGAFKDSHTDEEIKNIMAYLRHEAKLLQEKSKE